MGSPAPKGPAIVTTLLVSAGCWHGGSPAPEPPPQSCEQAGDCVDNVYHGVAVTPAGPLANTELEITAAGAQDSEPLPSVTTDDRGRFAFRIDKGIRAITISAVGYEPVISPVNPVTKRYEVRLRPSAPPPPLAQPVT